MSSAYNHQNIELSLVVPMYNEQETISIFFERVVPILKRITSHYEIVCINDGSCDRTLEILRAANTINPCIKIIDLSRNFGKELALTAGIDYASGQAVIPIDCDLQDPPALIEEMVAKWREGYDMVLAVCTDRSSDSVLKRLTAQLFYKLMSRTSDVSIPPNVGDFRLMDRRVVVALANLPERTRFMKGIFAWVGFRQARVFYKRAPRVAGKTKWRFWSLWNLALEGIISFTTLPLKVWSYIGFTCSLFAMVCLVIIIGRTLLYGIDVPGYASLLSVTLFFNGLIMIGIGILGEYIARVFIEVKRRPLYLAREVIGFASDSTEGGADLSMHDTPSTMPAID